MKRSRELGAYILAGGITTAVNYILYGGLLELSCPYLVANGLAWIGAVLAAYGMNRGFVFRSHNQIGKEFAEFVSLRLLTLAAETVLLWLFVDQLHIHPIAAKLLVSIVTVLGNYGLCKYKIFQKGE